MYPHCEKEPVNAPDWFEVLVALARYLRGPDGCPWDRQQTALNFARYARGEAEELVEAFGEDDQAAEEELGDTLFCLLAAAVAAEEEGRFTLCHALARAHEKMIRRHAHVFGEQRAATPEDAVEMWNRVKETEKNNP
jgi:tetrapyrrole methylase family protein/MazG family protein